jgi:hypothetical protein
MHQHFTPQELADHFTLMPEDAELFAQKTGVNRLGCAVLLKCLQWKGRFPTTWYDVPREVIHHIAQAGPAREFEQKSTVLVKGVRVGLKKRGER